MKTVEWKKRLTAGGVVAETASFARGFVRITVRQAFTIKREPENFKVRVNGKWHSVEFSSMEEAKQVGIAVARTACRTGLEELPRTEERPGNRLFLPLY